jgi:acyl-CoA synthetase (NDP forming)
VDTGRPGPGYDTILRAVADDESINIVGVYGITEPVISLPDSVAASGIAEKLPVLIGVDGPEHEVSQARRRALAAGVPLLTGPTALARGLEALGADARAQYLAEDDGSPRAIAPPIDATGPWDEDRAKELLARLGFSTPARRACVTRADARTALAELGAPVAVKILDATILHKTEIGGVHLGVSTPEDLEKALDALEKTGARAILVEKMADKGVDLVLGVRRDPVFGPIVLLGVGGVATEVYADSVIRSLPVTRRSAAVMPRELAAAELLHGFRGGPTVDGGSLVEHIRMLGAVLEANPSINEIEINPLRLTQSGLLALDAVVITEEN